MAAIDVSRFGDWSRRARSGREWRVEKIEISGNQRFPDSQLIAEMVTQARPWYRFWEERPLFDPVTFATDLDRLRRFYQSEGYYKSRITHNIDPDETRGLVSLEIYVEENSPVVISQVLIKVDAEPAGLSAFTGEISHHTHRDFPRTEVSGRGTLLA